MMQIHNVYVYTIVYDKDHISFYLNKNSSPFWSFKTPSKLYFSSPITLNEGGKLNAELYGFMMYDRVLSEREKNQSIKEIKNSDVNKFSVSSEEKNKINLEKNKELDEKNSSS